MKITLKASNEEEKEFSQNSDNEKKNDKNYILIYKIKI